MSERQELVRYLFEGNSLLMREKVVRLSGTTVPTATTYPKGTFCVIDYKDNDADHDVYIYGEATTDSLAWILVNDETA